jgi:DNA polymerase
MTPVEYVLDSRFEVIMLAVKPYGQPTFVLEGHEIGVWFASLDPNDTMLVTHNALFDMCIVAWIYNFVPKLMVDTLGVSRALLAHVLPSCALKSVALHLGLGVKGDTVHKVIGMRAADIKAYGIWEDYKTYNVGDAVLCEGIYEQLVRSGRFPMSEVVVMDSVLRMALQPQLVLDQNALLQHLSNIQIEKTNMLNTAMAAGANGKADLMSNESFARLLEGQGVDPPMKISPVTGRESYAFAKTDPAFLDLQEHPNPMVQVLVAARLGHKSTIEESRTERLISISNLNWPGKGQAKLMPVPLRFSGAHTHRFSGDWKLNMQNLPARKSDLIRRALTAPPGHKVVAIDSSQIEARLVAWLCGAADLLEQFATGQDPYSIFAELVFGYPVSKATPKERFLGKTSILGMGFGVGWKKFQRTVLIDSLAQTGTQIALTDMEAARFVEMYRTINKEVPQTWGELNSHIRLLAGGGGSFSIGPCDFFAGRIRLPSGLDLKYHNLENTSDGWKYTYGGKPRRLYGGALLENIIQALARIIITDAIVRIRARLDGYGIRLALQVHDELVYIVPDAAVALVKSILTEEMNRRPVWAPNLPLNSECKAADNYADCK